MFPLQADEVMFGIGLAIVAVNIASLAANLHKGNRFAIISLVAVVLGCGVVTWWLSDILSLMCT